MVILHDKRARKVTINLPPILIEKARAIGLNISKVSENALNDLIHRIENSNHPNNPENIPIDATSKTEIGSPEETTRLYVVSTSPIFFNIELKQSD